ncbi:MAG: hypothetical protein GEU86_22160 [Actinophytocola sp.]|nr:hypothetical protein [Actinophytocola sp.]
MSGEPLFGSFLVGLPRQTVDWNFFALGIPTASPIASPIASRGMNIRWGFEEDDEWDDPDGEGESTTESDESITGQDRDGIVTVAVNEAGDVVSVRLAGDWKNSVDPRALHTSVVDATNAATMHALAVQVEQVDMTGQPESGTGVQSSTSEYSERGDSMPITKEDAMRLVDTASADLERYLTQASTIIDAPVTTTSAGGHVTVSGRQRQVLDVSIDTNWVGDVRYTEIESELLDALTGFSTQSSLGELAQGPQSAAITELMSLASDPQALVRRIRRARES